MFTCYASDGFYSQGRSPVRSLYLGINITHLFWITEQKSALFTCFAGGGVYSPGSSLVWSLWHVSQIKYDSNISVSQKRALYWRDTLEMERNQIIGGLSSPRPAGNIINKISYDFGWLIQCKQTIIIITIVSSECKHIITLSYSFL